MISYHEALTIMTAQAQATPPVRMTLLDSLHHIAAEDIASPIPVPGFRNSAMDGFAVCTAQIAAASESNPITLPIHSAIAAGSREPLELTPKGSLGSSPLGGEPKSSFTILVGGAAQIMTGAMVPEPYDAVVPVELVRAEENRVTFTRPARVGDHIRHPGEDVQTGQMLVHSGECVTPETIMLLAATGVSELAVRRTPSLHILSTGNEISDDYHLPLHGTQIYNSNAPYLLSAAQAAGLEASYGGIVRDDAAQFEQKIAARMAAQKNPKIILSTGAVSKGVWDFIPDSLKNMGAMIHFHRVNIRPGKPVLFATLPNGSFYVGLPGNPISSAIGFTFFVLPLVRTLQGLPPSPPLMAALENNFTKKGDFCQFLKSDVWVDGAGCLRARIADGQESFKISPMAANNAWVALDESKNDWRAGDGVPVYLYGALRNHKKDSEQLCQAA